VIQQVEQAIDFVRQRGFIFFWPIQGIELPSLWVAVAGDRPVAEQHEDPGHVTWGWKDAMLGKRVWYYAKVIRKRATLIDLNLAPYFYALSENYGSPEEDYLLQYQEGRMKQETKVVYEILLHEGPMDTVALRRKARMTSRQSDYRFNRSLVELQMDFKILPVGVAEAGAWRYSFVYDLVTRHLPSLPEKARPIGESEARRKLVELYLLSVGAVPYPAINRLFQWGAKETEETVDNLVQDGSVEQGWKVKDVRGEWVVTAELAREKG
jgi:hypothetical protein